MIVEPHGRKVLIVEDDAVYRQLLILALSMEGYEARGAENGAVALRAIEADRPDAVVLDLVMPVLDGLGFLRSLKDDLQVAVPVLVLTCLDQRGAAVDALIAGAGDVLTKPAPLKEIVSRLAAVETAARSERPAAP